MTYSYQQVTEVEANWQATLRARLGFVDGTWLYYATAGVAWIDIDWKDAISVTTFAGTANFSHSKNSTQTGFTAGAGVEKELNNPLWRARLEYLYEIFDDLSVPHGATSPAQIGNLDIDDVHKIRFAINRKIGNN